MHVLGIVGAGAITLRGRLAARLDGHVATVESLPESATESEPTDGAAAAYGFSPDGNWVGSGNDRDLDGLLNDLSAEYDYVLLSGFPDARVPAAALAGADAVNVVAEAETVDVAGVASLVAEIDPHEPHVTPETLIERAKADPLGVYAGAITTLTGRVCARESEDDDPMLSLEFEKYDGVAESKTDMISEELETHDGVLRVLIHHRVGVVEDGVDIVFVVALAGHRREAFRMVEDGIDRLKDEVPIFKKETTTNEKLWVHDC